MKEMMIEIYGLYLQKLAAELSQYKDEERLWLIKEDISNSAGNLCLHLLGNLNHFIGATLGHTGYVRHREDEFSLKNIPRQDLLVNIENCRLIVQESLTKLTEADMAKEFPLELLGKKYQTGFVLTYLCTHLSYHLGQINYHRRLLDN
jgi:hypothetical protein